MNEDTGLQEASADAQSGLTCADDFLEASRASESAGTGNENTNVRLTRLLSGETAPGLSSGDSA